MPKKILTLDNLYQFFVEQNKTVNFSAKETGAPIVVTTDGFFAESESDMPGMLQLELKVCHIDTNRNGSHISKVNMEKAMPTLKYRPILAYIHELEDGTKDFFAHNIEITTNKNGEEEITYIEHQVGCFTADEPWLKYDEEMDKTYVHAFAVIPEEYTETADIIRRKNGTKVSCELVIDELSYNAKEKYLDLTDFYFGGCTLLGRDENGNEIGEGMLGSSIVDFCHKKPTFNYQDKLIETLEKLNFTLESLNKENNVKDKGGERDMEKLKELLAKYGKTVEEISFEVEGLSDEELEVKFEEEFGDADEGTTTEEDNADPSVSDEGEGADDDTGDVGDNSEDAEVDPEQAPEDKFSKTFTVELSHEDIASSLYVLIQPYEESDNEWYYIREVFDDYFYMQGWSHGKLYKQSYSVDGENVSLDGERTEVFELIVTESEKLAIEKMREDYSALEIKYNELKMFKDEYEAKELKAQKDAVLAKSEYECLKEDEAFKKLVEDAEQYSVEELSVKADLCFAAHVKSVGAFNVKKEETKKPNVLNLGFNQKDDVTKVAYAGLFENNKTK